jgi:hypothetical protein
MSISLVLSGIMIFAMRSGSANTLSTLPAEMRGDPDDRASMASH